MYSAYNCFIFLPEGSWAKKTYTLLCYVFFQDTCAASLKRSVTSVGAFLLAALLWKRMYLACSAAASNSSAGAGADALGGGASNTGTGGTAFGGAMGAAAKGGAAGTTSLGGGVPVVACAASLRGAAAAGWRWVLNTSFHWHLIGCSWVPNRFRWCITGRVLNPRFHIGWVPHRFRWYLTGRVPNRFCWYNTGRVLNRRFHWDLIGLVPKTRFWWCGLTGCSCCWCVNFHGHWGFNRSCSRCQVCRSSGWFRKGWTCGRWRCVNCDGHGSLCKRQSCRRSALGRRVFLELRPKALELLRGPNITSAATVCWAACCCFCCCCWLRRCHLSWWGFRLNMSRCYRRWCSNRDWVCVGTGLRHCCGCGCWCCFRRWCRWRQRHVICRLPAHACYICRSKALRWLRQSVLLAVCKCGCRLWFQSTLGCGLGKQRALSRLTIFLGW